MNERIRELIKQADIEFDVSSDHYGIDTAVVIPYDLEKFAELLIRECVGICMRNQFDGAENYNNGSISSAEFIKQHFGVLE